MKNSEKNQNLNKGFFSKTFIARLIFFLVVLIPFFSYIAWLLTPVSIVETVIFDKTVLNSETQEHSSLNWVLAHEKYTKKDKSIYNNTSDYLGFFPLKNRQYILNDLSKTSIKDINDMADNKDVFYYTDAYGIYTNEWYEVASINERSRLIYGGLSDEELYLLKRMKDNNKLILTEFNVMASPTSYRNRRTFEKLFGIKWSGWTARYYKELDYNINGDIPSWVLRQYEWTWEKPYDLEGPGVIYVHEDGRLFALLDRQHIDTEVPIIVTNDEHSKEYGVIERVHYPFWFDIIYVTDTNTNEIVSTFELNTLFEGDSLLKAFGVPGNVYPAVTRSKNKRFYYFSGDFADNPINLLSAYFKGITWLEDLYYDNTDPQGRRKFFWKYYRPFISTVFMNEYSYIEQMKREKNNKMKLPN